MTFDCAPIKAEVVRDVVLQCLPNLFSCETSFSSSLKFSF
jgi:hypothetical protein